MKKSKTKVVFKDYNPNQILLLPPNLEELIESNHPVRVVNKIIDSINIDELLEGYSGGGTSSYHPRMLLKVLVYGYLCNTYSSRKLESCTKENIHVMWLSGMQQPDHNTINRFRSERLKEVLKNIFAQTVHLLSDSGHLSLKELYTDGTKIEANANRYTFVWGNSIKYHKAKMQSQLKELWDYTQKIAKEELKDSAPMDFNEVSPESIANTVDTIHRLLKDKEEVPQKIKQKVNYAKRRWAKKLEEYAEQEKTLNGRNSYSKTDTEATFMRMKEDHMKNGQLKPAYNLQISTNNQYIVNYTLHPNPTDTRTLSSHLSSLKKILKIKPSALTTDAGYGSEENYALLEKENITAFIKYNYFDKEQSKQFLKENYRGDYLTYDEESEMLICPSGKPMHKTKEFKKQSSSGLIQHYTRYQAVNCNGCELREKCHQSKYNRKVDLNHTLKHYKQQATANLQSEIGVYHRKKRCYDVEPVFANIKHNKKFKRFNLKGKIKAEIETGLIALAHNLKKAAA